MSEREEHDPFEDKKRRFVSCYEEHWLFPGRGSTRDKKEEAHEWWKLIAEVRLSDIEPLVESVASQWPKDKAPRRGLFKTAIRQLRAARAEDLPPLDDCSLCDNSGMMWCLGRVAKQADGKEELTLSADPKDGPLSRFVTVCTCLRGRRFGDGDHRLQERILDWRTNELLPSAENSEKDYGLTTVGKFHAVDLLHESFSAVRAEMAEKAGRKTPE